MSQVVPKQDSIDEFGAALRGRLIRPDTPEYDEARTIYNGAIDKSPRLIARCVDAGDVISAVRFGCEHSLDISIRSGGHNGPGLSLVDDGPVIDLSSMKGIRVDPQTRSTVLVDRSA